MIRHGPHTIPAGEVKRLPNRQEKGLSARRKGKILLISRSIPPAVGGTSVVVGNLAKQFHRHEMVLIGEWSPGPKSEWREDWPELIYSLKALHRLPRRKQLQRLMLPFLFPLLLLRILRVARNHGCKNIIVIYPTELFLLVGYLVANLTNASFYPYFLNLYVQNSKGLARRFARWFQPRVFQRAKHVFVMSEGMQNFYRKSYPELVNCSPLVHSFSEPTPVYIPPPTPSDLTHFMMIGSINEGCRDAAQRMWSALKGLSDIRLTLHTNQPRHVLEKWGFLGENVRLSSANVSADLLRNRLQEADFVLLPHGFQGAYSKEEYQTGFPTRTIDYLLCGRPILAHSPPGAFLTQFLKHHKCALVVEEPSESAFFVAVKRLREDAQLREGLVRNALKTADVMFQASTVADDLVAILSKD